MSKYSKTSYQKPPLTFEDQVVQLDERGLVIQDKLQAKFYLSQINYYRLAAYFRSFETNHETHEFIEGTSFDDVMNLYIFDRELRLHVQMTYWLSHNHQIDVGKMGFPNNSKDLPLWKVREP